MDYRPLKALLNVKKPGSNIHNGIAYNELPFDDFNIGAHRKGIWKRINKIAQMIPVMLREGRKGCDLGCATGGLTFGLQLCGARMTGYDYDSGSITFARAVEEEKQTGAHFVESDLLDIDMSEVEDCEFCIWVSTFMWVAKTKGADVAKDLLFEISRTIPRLVFSTSTGHGMAGQYAVKMGIVNDKAVRELLINDTVYSKVHNFGPVNDGWMPRSLFKACSPKINWRGWSSHVSRISRQDVLKEFKSQPRAQECMNREKLGYERLQGRHFAVVKYWTDKGLCMAYCGPALTKDRMPSNWQVQQREILDALAAANVMHRDIMPSNLMVKNGVIKLVDFGWICECGKEYEDKPPRALGLKWRPASGEFDDAYSLKKSLGDIRDGRA